MQHRAIARALHYPTEGLINKTIKNEVHHIIYHFTIGNV
jgi:hypothetical protein